MILAILDLPRVHGLVDARLEDADLLGLHDGDDCTAGSDDPVEASGTGRGGEAVGRGEGEGRPEACGGDAEHRDSVEALDFGLNHAVIEVIDRDVLLDVVGLIEDVTRGVGNRDSQGLGLAHDVLNGGDVVLELAVDGADHRGVGAGLEGLVREGEDLRVAVGIDLGDDLDALELGHNHARSRDEIGFVVILRIEIELLAAVHREGLLFPVDGHGAIIEAAGAGIGAEAFHRDLGDLDLVAAIVADLRGVRLHPRGGGLLNHLLVQLLLEKLGVRKYVRSSHISTSSGQQKTG